MLQGDLATTQLVGLAIGVLTLVGYAIGAYFANKKAERESELRFERAKVVILQAAIEQLARRKSPERE